MNWVQYKDLLCYINQGQLGKNSENLFKWEKFRKEQDSGSK